jgi:CubicO group peptidase (beta-lactamase class C family)
MKKMVLSIVFLIIFPFNSVYADKKCGDLDYYIRHMIKTDHIPGMSAAIVVGEQVAWSKGYGYANLETKQPMSADTSFFEIASVTKLFTATALMIAQEQGFLSIDDNIDDFLITAPFKVDGPRPEPITFRHLASHTSGIVDSDAYDDCAYFVGDAFGDHQIGDNCPESTSVDLEGFLASYLEKDGLFYKEENFADYAPGEYFQYSNIGAGLEGYLIGLAAGEPLDQFAMRNIFEPLGMHNTSWNYDDLYPKNIAVPYQFNQEEQKLIPLPLYSLATWPDGGLKTSANDMGRFLSAVMNFGTLDGNTILSKESVSEMINLKNFQDANGEGEVSIGIHWYADSIGDRIVIGHSGGDPGVTSGLFFDPNKKIGIVLLINRGLDGGRDNHIPDLVDLLFKKAEKLKQKNIELRQNRNG